MIADAFMTGLMAWIGGIFAQLPDIQPNSSMASAITSASGYLSSMNKILPLDNAVLPALTAVLLFESIYLAFKVFYWILRRFPTQS